MDKRSIRIICFAGLRKYFGSETNVRVGTNGSYSDIVDQLKLLNPEATEVLTSCRIAVNEDFVLLSEPLKPESTIYLIPPSSGG